VWTGQIFTLFFLIKPGIKLWVICQSEVWARTQQWCCLWLLHCWWFLTCCWLWLSPSTAGPADLPWQRSCACDEAQRTVRRVWAQQRRGSGRLQGLIILIIQEPEDKHSCGYFQVLGKMTTLTRQDLNFGQGNALCYAANGCACQAACWHMSLWIAVGGLLCP